MDSPPTEECPNLLSGHCCCQRRPGHRCTWCAESGSVTSPHPIVKELAAWDRFIIEFECVEELTQPRGAGKVIARIAPDFIGAEPVNAAPAQGNSVGELVLRSSQSLHTCRRFKFRIKSGMPCITSVLRPTATGQRT